MTKEQPLRAVIIADVFDEEAPAAITQSDALLPFCGSTVLDYTLASLSLVGVRHVIICSKVAIAPTQWMQRSDVFDSVQVESVENAVSEGDFLRDLDSKRCLGGDFILTRAGSIFSAASLVDAIAAHRKRRAKDSNAVLTLVYAKCSESNRLRSRLDDVFVILHRDTQRIVQCQRLDEDALDLTIDDDLEAHFDLIDPYVAICSNQIAPLFTDNFDYQTRHDLMRDIIINEELHGQQMYAHVLNSREFVACATRSDFSVYFSTSRYILSRWAYPLCPETVCTDPDVDGPLAMRNSVYRYAADKQPRNVHLHNAFCGKGAKLGDGCVLQNVVLSEKCMVGARAKLRNCLLLDGASIGDDAVLENVIVCEGAKVGASVALGPRVIVSAKHGVEAKTKQQMSGVRLPDASPINWLEWEPLVIETKRTGLVEAGEESESEEDDDEDVEEIEDEDAVRLRVFQEEVADSIKCGLEEGVSCDTIALEINGSKHANNIAIDDVHRSVMMCLLSCSEDGAKTAGGLAKSFKSILERTVALLEKYSLTNPRSAQLNYLSAIVQHTLASASLSALPNILHSMYDSDVLEEDVILEWHPTLENVEAKKKLETFVKWLSEAEEESD